MARRKHKQLPPRSDYYVATVHCLKEQGGSATIEEMEEAVAEKLHLSEKARNIPHGDGRRTQFQYDLAWVRTYLKWGGALENSDRGVWHLTARGREMSDEELRDLWRRIVAEQRTRRKLTAKKKSPRISKRLQINGMRLQRFLGKSDCWMCYSPWMRKHLSGFANGYCGNLALLKLK